MQEQRDRNLNGRAQIGPRAVPAATYWRRRFIVLTALLLVLVAAGWSLSEALKIPRGATGPAGSRSPQKGTESRPNFSAKPSPAASGSGGISPALCPSQSIVLSLSTSQSSSGQSSYGPAQLPFFRLSVVSTQPADCSFNIGASHLAVLIKKGTARIWSSSDCTGGSRGLVTVLKRGVPTGRSIGWGRNTSVPGCAGPMRFVRAGTYAAYAVDGPLVSAPVTLRLR